MSSITISSRSFSSQAFSSQPLAAATPMSGRERSARVGHATRGPRVRLTRRGRVVFFVTFLAFALGLMVTLGGFATALKPGGRPVPVQMVQVQDGDTLYGIAGQFAGPGQVRDLVAQLKDLNALNGSSLQVGQELAVPVQR